MDWFKGKPTGNHIFSHEMWGFPVFFPLKPIHWKYQSSMTSWRSWEKLPGLLSQLHDLGDSGFHRFQTPTLWRHLAVSSSCLKFQHKLNMIPIYIYIWHIWNIWNMTCITLTYSHIWHIWKICWFVRINSTWFSYIYIWIYDVILCCH